VSWKSVWLACAAAWVLWAMAGSSVAAQGTPTPQPDPASVVEAFERARGAADVDAALAQFADTAVITIRGRTTMTFAGATQLRSYMQSIGTRFQIVMRSRPLVQGSTVTWTERDQFSGQTLDATVVAVVSAGRIVSLTYRDDLSDASRSALAAGVGNAQPRQLPSIAWPAGLALLGLGCLAVVFGRPRRKATRSQLDGRLLIELRRERERSEKKAA
jgi:hypothetical protein